MCATRLPPPRVLERPTWSRYTRAGTRKIKKEEERADIVSSKISRHSHFCMRIRFPTRLAEKCLKLCAIKTTLCFAKAGKTLICSAGSMESRQIYDLRTPLQR